MMNRNSSCIMSSGCFHFGNNHFFLKFAGCEDVLRGWRLSYFCFQKFRNLTLSKLNCVSFDSYIYTCVTLWCLIDYELRIVRSHVTKVMLLFWFCCNVGHGLGVGRRGGGRARPGRGLSGRGGTSAVGPTLWVGVGDQRSRRSGTSSSTGMSVLTFLEPVKL